MTWLSVSFEVEAVATDAVTDALMEVGATGVEITDADAGSEREQPVFGEPGAAVAEFWPRNRVNALFRDGEDVAALLAQACVRAGIITPPHRVSVLAEQDWVRTSRDQFSPICISPRLWIVPSWHPSPDPAAINLCLDPGLAFGTGSHPTTRLCLRWLERVICGGESVLDYGCGSGILAIAAMKLGAARAEGVDIDPQAVLAARANAIHNQVQVAIHSDAGAVGQPAQIVVANILSRPLVLLAPLIARLTAPGGRLALAGLLAEQVEEVRAAYRNWFDFDAPVQEEGWALLDGRRRTP